LSEDDDLRDELLASFEIERAEHLAAMREMLAAAESEGLDSERFDIADVYRRAHSLKGASRAVGLGPAEAVAHRLETLLQAVFEGGVAFTPDLLRGTRIALAEIEDLSAAQIRGDPADPEAALARLDALLEANGIAPPAGAPAAQAVAARSGRAGEAEPALRIESRSLDALLRTSGALTAEIARQERFAHALRELCALTARPAMDWRGGGGALPDGAARRLAEAGRLALALAEDFDERAWRLGRLAKALRDDLEQARLVPVENQFAGLARMIRDLARSQGKEVEVDGRGWNARVDRGVLQELKDPLVHLMRNAVDHGIETPQERAAAGKDPVGRILVHAAVAGGRLVLRIEDDGRGLDEGALARRGVEAGAIDVDEARTADRQRLHALIFQPGLSTAGRLTSLSGRGLGMAIVRQVVDRLQGSIAVDSRAGRGTRFDLELPVSLIGQRMLIVALDGQEYGLPAASVGRVETLARDQVFVVEGHPMLRVDDVEAPVIWLSQALGLPPPAAGAAAVTVVMLKGEAEGRAALVVDAVLAAEDRQVAALPAGLANHPLLSGTMLNADGSLSFVLSVSGLLAHRGAAAPPPPAPAPDRAAPAPLILVVDDSVTTRTLERSILEAQGFRVAVAVNGREALDRLAEGGVDLVVSDIEMPLMDGFALLKTVKDHPTFAHIPVVLVTSKEAAEDKERGLHLGADAYIVKRHFNQSELLDTIRQLLP